MSNGAGYKVQRMGFAGQSWHAASMASSAETQQGHTERRHEARSSKGWVQHETACQGTAAYSLARGSRPTCATKGSRRGRCRRPQPCRLRVRADNRATTEKRLSVWQASDTRRAGGQTRDRVTEGERQSTGAARREGQRGQKRRRRKRSPRDCDGSDTAKPCSKTASARSSSRRPFQAVRIQV